MIFKKIWPYYYYYYYYHYYYYYLKITNSSITAKLANALPSFPISTLITFNTLPRSMKPVYEGRAIDNNYW